MGAASADSTQTMGRNVIMVRIHRVKFRTTHATFRGVVEEIVQARNQGHMIVNGLGDSYVATGAQNAAA